MSDWLSNGANIFTIGAYVFAGFVGVLNYGRASQRSNDAIVRLEDSIKELVKKIDKLIDNNTDIQSRLSDHAARLTNLERER